MFPEMKDNTSSKLTEIVDGNNHFFGVFDKSAIRGTSLFYRAIVVLVRSKKTNRILLGKTQQSLFDFTFKRVQEFQKSSEGSIEVTAMQLLGEKPMLIREMGTLNPENNRVANFTTFFEIHYSDSFLSNAVRKDRFSLQSIPEFMSLCHYYPQDIDPLLRRTAQTIYQFEQQS